MKKLFIPFIVASLLLNPLNAEEFALSEQAIFVNLRESETALIGQKEALKLKERYAGSGALDIGLELLNDRSINRCATKFVATAGHKLGLNGVAEMEEFILGLRVSDAIDDVAAELFIKAARIKPILNHAIAHNNLTAEEEVRALDLYRKQVEEIKGKKYCAEDAYRSIVFELYTGSLKFKKTLKHINYLALEKKIISEGMFKDFENLRAADVHEWPMTLSKYAANLESIAKKFPERKAEQSQTMTKKGKWKGKNSLRQTLHEKFNSTQIYLLADVIKKMKKRLDSKNIQVHINYSKEQTEIINFSPMEKFRFILKLLRKELATLNNGSLLGGQQATYIDIIAAAYEVGYINSVEIEQLAALEEIWNPQKTTKEKVMFWVKTFGGVASVFLPPPFGFVSVLAIMLIDQQIADAPVDRDSDFNLL